MKFFLFHFMEAYRNYRRLEQLPFNRNSRFKFYKFVEIDSEASMLYVAENLDLSETTANRINWLAGPNHEFMYKVWKARHGDDT